MYAAPAIVPTEIHTGSFLAYQERGASRCRRVDRCPGLQARLLEAKPGIKDVRVLHGVGYRHIIGESPTEWTVCPNPIAAISYAEASARRLQTAANMNDIQAPTAA